MVKKVDQMTLEGELIASFQSIKEASIKTNISKTCIANVCRHVQKSSGGFLWKYTDQNIDYLKARIEKLDPKTLHIVCTFENIEQASENIGYSMKKMSKYLEKAKILEGYLWKYVTIEYKCQYSKCWKYARYNFPDIKIGVVCVSHKEKGMVKNRGCFAESCGKQCIYNYDRFDHCDPKLESINIDSFI